ncbi:flagellar basal body rod protein FlgB [Arsenicitalea aurantiaca]|uniref:Flagellar basal body rod protein FlgB n=1 Tax=Arsenicitalea aurantiaca TaxID=1783274 RepID=A0A433XG71_9HYPH|nr:flagellar basal body rod protein FlgB [Arsenicitalea aurantiaca]RUT33117.1 flagellar basal body rod protein FlgB [Arsenicitalea aurantiaca]
MSLAKLPIFTALADKMRWHQTRQGLLAENVANADTPGYRGRDLTPFSFDTQLRTAGTMQTATTRPGHIAASAGGASGFGESRLNNFEITPAGNGVTLEDEMMKVTSNQLDYQAATSLYTKSIKIIRTALGRQA